METETTENLVNSVTLELVFAFCHIATPIDAYYLLLAYSELERGEFFQAKQTLNDVYARTRSAKARAKLLEAITILDSQLTPKADWESLS